MGYAAKIGSNTIPNLSFRVSAYASAGTGPIPYALLRLYNINTAFGLLYKKFKYQFYAKGSGCKIYTHTLYKANGSSETGVNNKEYLCKDYTYTYMQTASTMSGSWPNTMSVLDINFYN